MHVKRHQFVLYPELLLSGRSMFTINNIASRLGLPCRRCINIKKYGDASTQNLMENTKETQSNMIYMWYQYIKVTIQHSWCKCFVVLKLRYLAVQQRWWSSVSSSFSTTFRSIFGSTMCFLITKLTSHIQAQGEHTHMLSSRSYS